MANEFEEMRSSRGVLYKPTGKLSDSKEANITVVPKTELVYMHINDNSNACENGTFDKNKSSFVSLCLQEACKLRLMMSTMDPKATDLLTAVRPQGKKRKLEATHDSITASDADTLLADFNVLQGNGALTNGNQLFSINGIQPTAANVQYAPLSYESAQLGIKI